MQGSCGAKGLEVVVLEGNDRPGGRVYSMKLEVHTFPGCFTCLLHTVPGGGQTAAACMSMAMPDIRCPCHNLGGVGLGPSTG